MSLPKIFPVILCGGAGTRLWPLSRKTYPKQFSPLLGQQSLFQRSALRCSGAAFAKPIVVTGDPFRFIVVEQLAAVQIDPAAILIEPTPRNTAPAILSAALWAQTTDPDAMLLVLPSDHVIPDETLFRTAVQAGVASAQDGSIVSFGITPDRPETGYGYLEVDGAARALVPMALKSFVEKPDLARAQAMLADGRHLWNAGIFLFSARTLIRAFETHAPAILAAVRASVAGATRDLGLVRLDPAAWEQAEDVSIDYAIMEKSENLVAVPFNGLWSDLGGWEAVWKESGPDLDGNVVSDNATALACSGSLLRSEDEGLHLVGLGLTDIIAVAMHQQNRRLDQGLARQGLGLQKTPRNRDNTRDSARTAWRDMQAHHRALGKADQRDRANRQTFLCQNRVDKPVQIVRRRLQALTCGLFA